MDSSAIRRIQGTTMVTGWEKLWRNDDVRRKWAAMEPLPGVVALGEAVIAAGGRRALDLGCGVGRHTLHLASRGLSVVGMDNAPTALGECRRLLAGADLAAPLVIGDMLALPFQAGAFDALVATNVVHHVRRSRLPGIVADITRVLVERGWLFVVMPTPRHRRFGQGTEIEPGTWVDPSHNEGGLPHTYLEDHEVRELLAAYEIVSMPEIEFRDPGKAPRCHWQVTARRLH
jgi:tellurite methyltransferase